jgi:carbonic anhydrase
MSLETLLANNRRWADGTVRTDPDFFRRLAAQQAPKYLWIGCSDSRVPANQIIGLPPGEVFVHRNVANLVVHTDLNCLLVLQYAVEVLRVEHVIVCGHYGCGGVTAAHSGAPLGLIDSWLRHIQDAAEGHLAMLTSEGDPTHRIDRLCELNVLEQAHNVCRITILQDAWKRGQSLSGAGANRAPRRDTRASSITSIDYVALRERLLCTCAASSRGTRDEARARPDPDASSQSPLAAAERRNAIIDYGRHNAGD